jgi:predicted acylesterase/phospholipase RssA
MRCHRRSWIVAGVLSCLPLAASPLRAQGGNAPPATSAVARRDPPAGAVALTIEGGGSLGAYEAGMSWALVEALRQRRQLDETAPIAGGNARREASPLVRLPRLDLVTSAGASAGSINALLASISWCSAAPATVPESSSFWKAWMPTGVSQLIPAPRTPDWSERGIFTPSHLRTEVLPDVRKAWSSGGFVPGCRVAFGATITKASADSVLVAKSLYARNQRFAAAAVVGAPDVRTAATIGPSFTQPTLGAQSFGPTGYLLALPDSGGRIAPFDIEQLITASSAYPLAFAPAPLRFCRTSSGIAPNGRPSCTHPDSADFLDGAIFDNGPLALAYDLAHATEPMRTRTGLYLLYLTPDRRRGSVDSRRDMFLARAAGEPVNGGEAPPSGLDAGLALIGNFIPAARQYELQLAARTLPQSTSVEEQLAQKEAALMASGENVRRMAAHADSEHAAHLRAAQANDSAWARVLADEATQRRQAQYVSAICRMRPAECGSATAIDSLIATGGVDSIPPASVPPRIDVQEPTPPQRATADSVRPEEFAHTFFVSTRWHPLAGEWLSGIGAFLGEPLREYDFYVGIYDAFSIMARDAICGSDSATDACTARTLRQMIDDPPVVLSRRARMALDALYRGEYPASRLDSTSRGGRASSSSVTPASPHDSLVIAVIDAMQARMTETGEGPRGCRTGSFIQRAACVEGIDAFFAALRSNGSAMRAIKGSIDACDEGGSDDVCFADRDFLRVVRNPGRELNRISELALHRLDETTPAGGHTKPLLILASATYYSTNEATRSGWDFGSTSLPSSLYAAACDSLDYGNPALRHLRRCAQGALRFYPSSVGIPLFPSSAQYAEWTMRYNWPGTFAAGVVTRLMTSNGRRLTGEASPRMIEAPGFRLERKMGNLLVPTVGLDAAYWFDTNHSLFHQPGVNRAAYGVTATILASKLRFAVTRVPDGYRTQGARPLLWTAGIGDVNGMIYWLWRLTTE